MSSTQASLNALTASLREDPRAYPERSFPTIVLPCSSADVASPSASSALNLASVALRAGQLVAFPTETVYGLGANALDGAACARIFAAKHRPTDNPLIVHVSSSDMLAQLTPPNWVASPAYAALMDALWPGPLTLLLPAGANVPAQVTAGHKTVAARMPLHAVALALIAHAGTPLAAPSANASGRPSPTRAAHVYADLQGRLPLILDAGAAQMGVESTVVDGVSVLGEIRVLRPGACTVEHIRAALLARGVRDRIRVYGRNEEGEQVLRDEGMEANPTTPGMKYRHYAPDAKVVLLVAAAVEGEAEAQTLEEVLKAQLERGHSKIGLMSLDDSELTATWQRHLDAASECNGAASTSFLAPRRPLRLGTGATGSRFSLGASTAPSEAAARLFQGLRALDGGADEEGEPEREAANEACDVILVEAVRDDGVGMAVMNRLAKAAGETVLIRVEK